MSAHSSPEVARLAATSTQRPGRVAAERQLLSSSDLRRRLALLALLLVGLSTVLLLLLVRQVFAELTPALEQDLRWKARQGVVELSKTADLGLLTRNIDALREATERGARERDFLYVGFRGAEGDLIYERGQAELAPAPGPAPTLESMSENEHAFASWAPLKVEGLFVGSVTLAVSKQRLDAGARLYRQFVVVGLVGGLVALVLAGLFVRRYIAPILGLTERTLLELSHTTDAALASVRAKSQFLANMSHEIRTPMNGVFGMLHLMERTPLSAEQRGYVDIMSSSAKGLLTIVNDVLDFSKLEANRYEVTPAPCRLRELFEESAALFRVKAREKELELRVEVEASVPAVVVLDAARLRQVIDNLLSNAVKFTIAGSVDVHVGCVEPEDAKARARATRWLSIRVSDTGIGIPESVRAQLFGAFMQVDGSSSREHEGTGLGLAISRKLVELMAGHIQYEPPSGQGSTFVVTLPLDESTGVAAAEVETEVKGWDHFESERPVLLVDDNEINLVVAAEILEKLGLRVEVAAGGREAVEAVLAGDYALVLMDCQMPQVDGYDATRQIRRQEGSRRVPIVAFTAHAFAEERAKVAGCGMDDFVTKPIELAQLCRVLGRWLNHAPSPVAAPRPPVALSSATETRTVEVLAAGRRRPPRAVQLFLRQVPEQLEQLRAAAAAGQRDEVERLAHKLKGGAGSLGALRLAELCERLQTTAKALAPDATLELVRHIGLAYAAARDSLTAEVAVVDEVVE